MNVFKTRAWNGIKITPVIPSKVFFCHKDVIKKNHGNVQGYLVFFFFTETLAKFPSDLRMRVTFVSLQHDTNRTKELEFRISPNSTGIFNKIMVTKTICSSWLSGRAVREIIWPEDGLSAATLVRHYQARIKCLPVQRDRTLEIFKWICLPKQEHSITKLIKLQDWNYDNFHHWWVNTVS